MNQRYLLDKARQILCTDPQKLPSFTERLFIITVMLFLNFSLPIKRFTTFRRLLYLVTIVIAIISIFLVCSFRNSPFISNEGTLFAILVGIFSLLGYLIAREVRYLLYKFLGTSERIIRTVYDTIKDAKESIYLYAVSPLIGFSTARFIFNNSYPEYLAKCIDFANSPNKQIIIKIPCRSKIEEFYKEKGILDDELKNKLDKWENECCIGHLAKFVLNSKRLDYIPKVHFLITDSKKLVLFGMGGISDIELAGFITSEQSLISIFMQIFNE